MDTFLGQVGTGSPKPSRYRATRGPRLHFPALSQPWPAGHSTAQDDSGHCTLLGRFCKLVILGRRAVSFPPRSNKLVAREPSLLTGPNDSQNAISYQLPEVQANELGCDAGDLGRDADRDREWERRHTSDCSAATAQTLVEVCLILRRRLLEPPHRRQPGLVRSFLDFQQESRDDESLE